MTTETGSLSLDFDLPHKPEKVWRALTEPALLSEWLLPAIGFQLAPGTAFSFKTQPAGGFDGTVNCQLLEVEPLRKLSFSWVVGTMEIDTVVTFTLTPTAEGTRLSLVHTGFRMPEQKGALGGTRYGWNMMTGKLLELLPKIQ